MTRITPELDRLAAARPETARHRAALTDEGERRRLLLHGVLRPQVHGIIVLRSPGRSAFRRPVLGVPVRPL